MTSLLLALIDDLIAVTGYRLQSRLQTSCRTFVSFRLA